MPGVEARGLASRGKSRQALVNPSKNGRSHQIPGKHAASNLFYREGFMIQEKIKGKANKRYIEAFL
jgi:hypothetical protein